MNQTSHNKILMVTGTLDRGGVEAMLLTLAKAGMKFDICVEIPDKGLLEEELLSLGCKVYHLTRRSTSMLKHHKEFFDIVKNYDIVHINTQNAFLALLEVKAAKKAGVKRIVVQSHNTQDWRSKMSLMLHNLCRNKLRESCIPCTCSKIAGEFLFNSESITVIPQIITIERFAFDEEKRKKIRKELSLSNTVLLHAGNFREQKNHKFMLKIMKLLEEEAPGCFTLLCAGSGELFEETKKEAEKENLPIKFLGSVSNMEEVMSASDIFILPSLHEGNPIVTLEAQTNGLPCLLADTITREADETGNVEFLSLDEDVWAKHIIECASALKNKNINRKEYEKVMGKNHSPENMIEKLNELYMLNDTAQKH